jgi:hypothetical protein
MFRNDREQTLSKQKEEREQQYVDGSDRVRQANVASMYSYEFENLLITLSFFRECADFFLL